MSSLDALEARVLALLDDLCGGAEAEPWQGGRQRWIAQDVGWRLLCLHADADGELAAELDSMVSALAAAPTDAGIQACIATYRALHGEWLLPSPGEMFGVGYRLPGGLGIDEGQLAAGIKSAMPATWALMGDDAPDIVSEFAHMGETPERRPIGRRFASFLAGSNEPSQWIDQARFEAAVTHAPPADMAEATLGAQAAAGDRVQAARGLALVTVESGVTTEPDALADAIGPLDAPMTLAVRRAPDGEVDVVQLSAQAAEALHAAERPTALADLGLDADEREGLLQLGLLVPEAWRI